MNATINRRRFLALAGASVMAGTMLAACNSSTDEVVAPGTDPGTTAPSDQLTMLKITSDGGFVPREWALTSLPMLLVADGTAFVQGPVLAIYPGPALTPVWTRTLDAAALEALATAAREAGLLTDKELDYGFPNVADAPTTTIEVTVGGTTYRQSIPALGLEDGGLTADQQALRDKAGTFVQTAMNLDGLAGGGHVGPETQYQPTKWRLFALTVNPDDYANDVEPEIRDWPMASIDLATASECTVVTGADAATIATEFADATQLTFFTQGEATYQVLVRPILPGETDC